MSHFAERGENRTAPAHSARETCVAHLPRWLSCYICSLCWTLYDDVCWRLSDCWSSGRFLGARHKMRCHQTIAEEPIVVSSLLNIDTKQQQQKNGKLMDFCSLLLLYRVFYASMRNRYLSDAPFHKTRARFREFIPVPSRWVRIN